MGLEPGTRFGPYEVVAPLGTGGMGEVYRARDTRLNRSVALKVLPAGFSKDSDRRQRFEREARAASSLNHPHICTLHDIGEQDGVLYLVMEHLEGESLAARLERGPLPIDHVLRFGIEIADALEKAHHKGIVHRDLKPGNIMLTKSGAKLLDFGLAKLRTAESHAPPSVVSALPTVERPLTSAGAVLGTFQYMAPEQLEGKGADPRTDVFALGAVLYEMCTARRAFSGTSQASLIAAILNTEPPPLSSLQPMTPPGLERLVKACLAKDPDDRIQTAHDVMQELKWIAEAGSQPGVPAPVAARRRGRERLAWGIATAAAVVALAFGLARGRESAPAPRTARLSILPPDKSTFSFTLAETLLGNEAVAPAVLSPDGRLLAFGAQDAQGNGQLWIRPVDSFTAKPLPGTEGASYPFWSSDSRFVGFFAGNKLKKIEAAGGASQVVCDAPSGRGGTWNREGTILFAPNSSGVLYRVPEAGGTPVAVTRADPAQVGVSHRWPLFLPDGRYFLFLAASPTAPRGSQGFGVFVGSIDSEQTSRVLPELSNAIYVPTGHLLFLREATLMAQPFDAAERRLTGEAVAVDDTIQREPDQWRGVFSGAAPGVLSYRRAHLPTSQLAWFDRQGKVQSKVGSPRVYWDVRIAPERRRVAATIQDPKSGAYDIWVIDSDTGAESRLTFEPGFKERPVWSPDGSRVLYSWFARDHSDLYARRADGSGAPEGFLVSDESKWARDWSRDGRLIAFTKELKDGRTQIWLYSVPDRKTIPFSRPGEVGTGARFSPDGRWLAYTSDETGRSEVYVRSVTGGGGRWQVSAGGFGPSWREDGKELIYVDLQMWKVSVDLTLGPTVKAGTPKRLFPFVNFVVGDHPSDESRFLFGTRVEDDIPPSISVILNWVPKKEP